MSEFDKEWFETASTDSMSVWNMYALTEYSMIENAMNHTCGSVLKTQKVEI